MSVARLPIFGRSAQRTWTAEDDAILLAHPSNADAAERLDRTPSACASRRRHLRQGGSAAPAPAHAWTADEDALLGQGLSLGEIHRRTGRTINAIKARMARLKAQAKAKAARDRRE